MENIILGRAGRNTDIILNDVKASNGADAMVKFIEAKKWGWNKPDFKKISNTVVAISEWAMGQVIGPRGFIVKSIGKAYGFIKIIPLPKEEDRTYKHIYAAVDYTRGSSFKVLDVEPKFYRIVNHKQYTFYSDDNGVDLGSTDRLIINEDADKYKALPKKEYKLSDYFTYIGDLKDKLNEIPDEAWVLHSQFGGGVWSNTTVVQIKQFDTDVEEESVVPFFEYGTKTKWEKFKDKVL